MNQKQRDAHRLRVRTARELLSLPGDTMLDTMEALKLDVHTVCTVMEITPIQFWNLRWAKTEITEEIAEKLQKAFKIDKSFWINRQSLYSNHLAEIEAGEEKLLK